MFRFRRFGSARLWNLMLILPLLFGIALGPCGCAKKTTTQRRLLDQLWVEYKKKYITPDGRVLDPRQNRVTSEGQSYGLLRAVWSQDRETFDRVLIWTEANLARADGLYAWLWRPIDGGRVSDSNTAADADQDIALALILAARAFDRPELLDRAERIVKALRRTCTVTTEKGFVVAAGNWAVESKIVNLSYFSPYAYAYFHRLDPDGGWLKAIEAGYRLIERTLELTGLIFIPDFIQLDDRNSPARLAASSDLSRIFSYDSMRIFWRLEMDCRLNERATACADPANGRRIARVIEHGKGLYPAYTPEGKILDADHESLTFYACLAPLLQRRQPEIYQRLLENQLSPDRLLEVARQGNRYYDLNWIWFGLAAAAGVIQERTPSVSAIPIS